MARIWIRVCANCGNKQATQPVPLYKDNSWMHIACGKCGNTNSLTTGSWKEDNTHEQGWEQ